MSFDLTELGWTPHFAEHFEPYEARGFTAGRISREDRKRYLVLAQAGELAASLAGRLRHTAEGRGELPTVGDWVVHRSAPGQTEAMIQALLPRKSSFSRKAVKAGGPQYGSGRTQEQVLAANIDTAFLVSSLDGNFNPRRIERYLTIAWDGGAAPVVILNKADLCSDIAGSIAAVEASASGAPIHVLSALMCEGLDVLPNYLGTGKTVAFLGSSGVGKSTIINALLGTTRQEVRSVRAYDDRGRHTTTAREMILLPGGGVLIDTPGLRELQMWDDTGGVEKVFDDIEGLAGDCRYRDCQHGEEPGCAVTQALEDGTLDPSRYRNYLKLKKEQAILAVRQAQRARMGPKTRREKRQR